VVCHIKNWLSEVNGNLINNNFYGLVSNAPGTAKSGENAVSSSGSGGVEALVIAAKIDDGNRV
jgi:hypothetical protein